MSRGGRGGFRGNQTGVMAVFKQAKDLQAISNMMKGMQTEQSQSMVVFPSLDVQCLAPLRKSTANSYIANVRAEHISRIRESSFYVTSSRRKRDIERYSDRAASKEGTQDKSKVLKIDPASLPPELVWSDSKSKNPKAPRVPAAEVDIQSIISRLEETDLPIADETQTAGKESVERDFEEQAFAAPSSDEEEEVEKGEAVIDDFGEDDEDNDYVQSYFDNGEAYAYDDDLGGAADDPTYD